MLILIRKKGEYLKTSINNIVNKWEEVGIKFIRIKFDKKRYVDLEIYNSGIFTKQSPAYNGVVILDRFHLRYDHNTMNSPAFDLVLSNMKKSKGPFAKMSNRKLKLEKWVTKEEMIEMLQAWIDFIDNTDEYRTADILRGDYSPQGIRMVI